MKKIAFLTIFLLSLCCIKAQEFEFPLYFEDTFGEKDTVFFGYDMNATVGIDEDFGEVNIKGNPLVGLDVRIIDYDYSNIYCWIYDNVDASSFHTKKQITNGSCALPNFPALAMIIDKNRFPIKVFWDKDIFSDACIDGPFLTDWHPGGWFDAPCDNTQELVFMGVMDSIVFETTSMGLVTVENDTVNYIFFNLQSSTSPVKEIYEAQDIHVIPNPTVNKQFHLEVKNFLPNSEVHIYNSMGQFIFKEKWTKKGQIFTLPHKGVFYISILSEGKAIGVKKVIRQ